MFKLCSFLLFLLLLIPTTTSYAKTQIVFLIDSSGSIDEREYNQIYLALKNIQLPETLKDGTVEIILWSTEPMSLSKGHISEFNKVIDKFWERGRIMSGATAVGYALNYMMNNAFDHSASEHYVILITDGDNNLGPSPLETNYRTWSIINKVNTSVIVIDDEDWLVKYYQPLKIGFKSLIVHAKNFDQLNAALQLLMNSIFTK